LALVVVLFASDDLRVRLFSTLESVDVGTLLILLAFLVYSQRKALGMAGGGHAHAAVAAAASVHH
jgi:hypothetical protein